MNEGLFEKRLLRLKREKIGEHSLLNEGLFESDVLSSLLRLKKEEFGENSLFNESFLGYNG